MQGSHDVIIAVNEEFFIVGEGDLAAAVLGKEHCVTDLDHGFTHGAILECLAGADRDHRAEVEAFLVLGREDDATLGLGKCFGLPNDDTIKQGSEGSKREHLILMDLISQKYKII